MGDFAIHNVQTSWIMYSLAEARVDNVLSRHESNRLLSRTYNKFYHFSTICIWCGCSGFFFFLAKDMVWLNLYTTNQKSPIGQSPWVDYNFLHL